MTLAEKVRAALATQRNDVANIYADWRNCNDISLGHAYGVDSRTETILKLVEALEKISEEQPMKPARYARDFAAGVLAEIKKDLEIE